MSTTKDIDLNSLFTLTYNFDNLKIIFQDLLEKQNISNDLIRELDKKIEEKDKAIQDLTDQTKRINLHLNISLDRDETEKKEIVRDRPTEDLEKVNDRIFALEKSVENNENLIKDIEKDNSKNKNKIKEMENQNYQLNLRVEELEFKLNNTKPDKRSNDVMDLVRENTQNIDDLKDSLGEKDKIIKNLQKSLEELSLKFSEINIFESLKFYNRPKNEDDEEEENQKPNFDEAKIFLMIESLKNSTTQKFQFIDQRNQATDDILSKIKADIQNLSKRNELFAAHGDEIDSKILNINTYVESLSINISKLDRNFNERMGNDIDNIRDYIDKKVDELKDALEQFDSTMNNQIKLILKERQEEEIKKEEEKSEKNETFKSDDLNQIRNKISDLEKNYKLLLIKNTEFYDKNSKDLADLEDLINKKEDKEMVDRLRDRIDKLVNKFNQIDNLNLEEELGSLKEDVAWLKKRLESLSLNILEIRNSQNSTSHKKDPGNLNFDLSGSNTKLVEYSEFLEYKKLMSKDINNIYSKLDDIRKSIEDILAQMQNKLEESDLRNLEGKDIKIRDYI